MPEDDVVLALPASVKPTRRLRSTLVLASIESVKRRGRLEDYECALPAEHRESLLHAVAATWVSLDAAKAHYAACDSLALSAEQQVLAGRSTFDGARSTLMGTAVGGVTVVRAGPKDAHIDVVQCDLLASSYMRNGLRGLVAGIMELFCTRAYVTERRPCGAASVHYRAQWARGRLMPWGTSLESRLFVRRGFFRCTPTPEILISSDLGQT